MSFKNKVVIVTGGSSGIGAATAVAFSSEGAHVVIVGRNKVKLAAVAEKCKDPLVIRADITKDEEVQNIIDKTIKKFGQIDVLVNNAGMGIGKNRLIDGNIMENYDIIMGTNLRGAINLTGLASPYLVKTKGNIINISSIAGRCTMEAVTMIYNVSKAALNHFTICAAAELGKMGVRVNAISPGPVKTDIIVNAGAPDTPEVWEAWSNITLLKKVSEPEEIADSILFLASSKAKSITGANIVIDNGALRI